MVRRLFDSQSKRTPAQALESCTRSQEESPERPRVSIVRCSTKLLDRDNLYGSVKGLLDQLCVAKLIPGDREDQIELRVEQVKVRKENVGTQVVIVLP
jgi:hypothetical protein